MRSGIILMFEAEFSSSDYDCGAGVWRPISASQCLRIVDPLLGYVNGGTDKVGCAA